MKFLVHIFLFGLMCAACAGPTTPFGANTSLLPKTAIEMSSKVNAAQDEAAQGVRAPAGLVQRTQTLLLGSGAKPEIKFTPDRQVLHGRTEFTITVNDSLGVPKEPDLTILYNGHDLTARFMAQARVDTSAGGNRLKLRFPNLRILPDRDNKIEVVYRHSKYDPYVFARYQPPVCDVFEEKAVLTTGTFKLNDEMLKTIHKMSTEHRINPAFLTGLIAQESAFNHRAVSWAKAIGLTQITGAAEQEVTKFYSHWPRYDGMDKISAPVLKAMILSGQVNGKNEWRLNPQMSIRGGLTYLTLLSNYWRRPENFSKISAQFRNPEEGFSQVILASYNSGFVRVGSALEKSGANWIRDDELREARKYVYRVMSYCYHFSHQGDEDADPT
ncbi:MAG TPA: transglycosylase SLT domain-containing protein [Bdellovibrionales bacterium]|nr:transglycosylase SLT domain-containing protein [Bdellovibrionales bacterium]